MISTDMQDKIRIKWFVMMCATLIVSCICSCTDDESPEAVARGGQHPIMIESVYPSAEVQTRADIDGGFVEDDAMGIFVVDRSDDGEPVVPAIGTGRASNIKFTLGEDGKWTSAVQLYWDAKGRAADFYGYYPFVDDLPSVNDYAFTVSERQDADAGSLAASGYNASDLLWAKVENVEPTVETVTLQYHHLMAGVTIRLEKGTGFTTSEWASLDKTVLLKNMLTAGVANLSVGTVTVNTSAEVKTISPLLHNGEWRAVTFPQTVEAGSTLVSVTIDGQSYALRRDDDMTFVSGKMHTFTITVDRRESSGQYTFTCSDEAITPWTDDSELHEGLVREYLIVEVSEPGRLGEDLARMGKDYRNVESMMVKGNINHHDLFFMGQQMSKLENLNLSRAVVVGSDGEAGVLTGFENHHILRHFVFPEKGIWKIADNCFKAAGMKGSLIIPEGVVDIGANAFSNEWGDEQYYGSWFDGHESFTGSLTLPSTLKRIGAGAFSLSGLRGEFRLPDGLEEYGYGTDKSTHGMFEYCRDLTGTYYIPPSLRLMHDALPLTLTGTLRFPREMTECGFLLDGCKCTSVVFHEGMTSVPRLANSEIRGELVLPSTVTRIRGMSFMNTKITKVIFPENLRELDDYGYLPDEGIFAGSRLTGTIELPKKVGRISKGCFMACTSLTGVVIPEGVLLIDEFAFAECVSLNSIVCEGEEPPLVADNAFLGVPKDNFTVEVPKGCVEKYRNVRGWSEFKRIAEYSNFVCRPAQVCALNSVHSEDLVLNADGAWRVARKPSWCSVSRESGAGKTALTVNILPMAHGAGNRQDTLVFEMQQGSRTIETACLLSQYDYEYEADSYITLQKASKGNNGGIDIVFAGDGYDAASIADGSYLDLVKYQSECFFAVEPYRSMREYFNVYVTFPLSQEKGVNTMYTYVNNRFGTLYGMNELTVEEMTSTALITESDEVVDYVVEKTPLRRENLWRSLVILVPNSTDYDGHTELMDNGAALVICPPSDKPYPRDTRGVVQHEAGGHGFGKLGDEEIVRNAFAPQRIKNEVDKMHERGWYQNLSTTGKLSQVPWADFIFDTRYSDFVDVYEGGYGYTRGIYRAEANSCMNYGIPYYNTPSRLEIYRRIKVCAGEEFSMDDFRQSDTFEWGATTITRSLVTDVKNLKSYADGNHQRPLLTDFRQRGNKVRQIINRLRKERINK